jgi:hypothetical protein
MSTAASAVIRIVIDSPWERGFAVRKVKQNTESTRSQARSVYTVATHCNGEVISRREVK